MYNNDNIERVFVVIDVNNLWHSCHEEFGPNSRVSYPALRDLIYNQNNDSERDLEINAYSVVVPSKYENEPPANIKFLQSLQNLGFNVKTKKLKMFGKTHNNPNWDVGITVDAMDKINTYDTFILLSGDGDYHLLLEHLKKKGKRIEVYTFRHSASALLNRSADAIFYLSENEIFCE